MYQLFRPELRKVDGLEAVRWFSTTGIMRLHGEIVYGIKGLALARRLPYRGQVTVMKRLIFAALIVGTAWGQQPPPPGQPGQDDGYAPDHGVARISFMNGNVSVRRGDSGDLVAAVLNAPLTATDRLATSDGSRAEVQFDSANMIRLGPATEVRFSELQAGRYQVQIATGTTTFRVLRDSNAQVEISTPIISVRPVRKGAYRVTVRPDGTSEITVRSGDAEIFGPRGTEQLHSGQTMLVRGAASDPEFQTVGQLPEDEFDRWAAARDRNFEQSTSYRYVNPDIYGAEDLDQNGRWQNDPQYGNVWVPTVDPGWAPYQCGRWTWVDFYGWTWVGCESWGWAPYHYGNWYNGAFGWSWYPGAYGDRYFWRPALVGFFGWGGGGGFGFGFGNVGWVPLAPHERFHPWYGRGGTGRPVIVNNTNITNVYRNARVDNGVTSVRAGDFGRTNTASNNFVRASAGDLSRAGAVQGQLPVSRSPQSNQFSSRQASTQGLPRTNERTQFFSRNQSPGGNQAAQQRGLTTSGSQPGGRGASGPSATGSSGGGWQRFEPSSPGSVSRGSAPGSSVQGTGGAGNPGSQSRQGFSQGSGAAPNNSAAPNNGGWQRFEGGNRGAFQGNSGAEPPVRSNGPQFQGNRGFSAPQPQVNQSQPQVNRGFSAQQPQFNQSQPRVDRGFSAQQPQFNQSQPRVDRGFSAPQPQVDRGFSSQPRQQPQSRSYSAPSQPRSYGSQGSVRVSPPIVQSRPSGGGNPGGGGGGSHSNGGGHGGGGHR
jgi:hypothetical protein